MTYYLYIKEDGHPDVTEYPLREELFPGHRFVSATEDKPDVYGKRYVNGKWERVDQTPEYAAARKLEYPKITDQLDALWHAMNDGLIPKIEPIYSEILAVKQAYPKPSN